jgi:hypothetical protein
MTEIGRELTLASFLRIFDRASEDKSLKVRGSGTRRQAITVLKEIPNWVCSSAVARQR